MAYQEDNSHAERGDCTPIRYLIISETVKGDPESIPPKVGMVQDDVMKSFSTETKRLLMVTMAFHALPSLTFQRNLSGG